MSSLKGRTDPRVIRTRQLIRDAFVDLLQTMNVEKITVNRLAERATINRVTFYLHYRDIPDMIEQLADDMVDDFNQILEGSRSLNSPDDKDTLLVKFLEHIGDNSNFFKAILAVNSIPVFTDKLLKLLSELITERIEEVEGASAINKDIAIWFTSSALIGVIVSWLRNDMPYTPSFLAKQFFLILSLRGSIT